MRVCYHLTIPPSDWAACDALVQEAQALQAHFGGVIHHLYPARRPGTRFPRLFWGILRWPKLWWIERHVTLHHFYNPDPYPFAILSLLWRPVIYTVSAGVRPGDRRNAQRLAHHVHTLVVATLVDRERLQRWGIDNVAVVRPGMDLTRFSTVPLPPDLPPTLLMGSAPWTHAQFRSKGVDALLDMARRWPDLHLVFLWRGLLYDEMLQRVRALGLGDRVEVINEQVDVAAVLARVHAAVILATEGATIKAYPHSLLEALAVGRPVLVSRVVPMAIQVRQCGYGVVVAEINVPGIQRAVKQLFRDYLHYQQRALGFNKRNFTLDKMLASYAKIYSDT